MISANSAGLVRIGAHLDRQLEGLVVASPSNIVHCLICHN